MSEKNKRKECACHRVFFVKSTYYSHIKKCGKAQEIGTPASTAGSECRKYHFKCNDCGYTCMYNRDFCLHLENEHQTPINVEELHFDDYNSFRMWKEDYERQTDTSFNLTKKTKRKFNRTEYYHCNRSGEYKSQASGKRNVRPQGTAKIGQNCTAAMTVHVSTSEDKTYAKICHTHYGHQTELAYLSIPKKVKQALAEQLKQGIDPNEILLKIAKVPKDKIERRHLVTRRDLLNISKAYNVPFPPSAEKRRPRDNNLLAYEKKIKKWKQKDMNLSEHDYSLTLDNEEDSFDPFDVAEEVVYDESMEVYDDTEDVKATLLLEIGQLLDQIKDCNDRDTLVRVKEQIEAAFSELEPNEELDHSKLEIEFQDS